MLCQFYPVPVPPNIPPAFHENPDAFCVFDFVLYTHLCCTLSSTSRKCMQQRWWMRILNVRSRLTVLSRLIIMFLPIVCFAYVHSYSIVKRVVLIAGVRFEISCIFKIYCVLCTNDFVFTWIISTFVLPFFLLLCEYNGPRREYKQRCKIVPEMYRLKAIWNENNVYFCMFHHVYFQLLQHRCVNCK